MQRVTDYIKAHAVFTAWKYGSHYGGTDHMTGVLWVIKNRSDAGWGSILHVVDTMEKWESAPPVTKTHPDQWDRRFVSLLNTVDSIFDHTAQDPTNSALWFGDLTNVTNEYFLTNVCRSPERQRCGGINSWTYFKNAEAVNGN